jgi:hypothetical protein
MSIITLEIDDAVTKFIEQPTSLLFIDTCAILDIVRLPFREKNPTTAKAHLNSAQSAIQIATAKKLRIIILPLVSTEYDENFPKTKDELSRHIKEVTQNLEILKAIHVSSGSQLVVPDLLSLNTESFLESICNNLMSSGVHITKLTVLY